MQLEAKLTTSKGDWQISLPGLFNLPPITALNEEERLARGQAVESAVRQLLSERCLERPFLSPRGGVNILIYSKKIDAPTALKFDLCRLSQEATGWSGMSAKVYLADRNEYEPDLLDIVTVQRDE